MPTANKQNSFLRDTFVCNEGVKWQLFEATDEEKKSQVNGTSIIGRAVGPFATMDGESLNGRRYGEALWDRQFEELKPRFEAGGLFGTCGHERDLNEDSIVFGTITHKTSRIWPDRKNKVVMGEMYIIGTDGGKNLYALMDAGMPIAVSSRAYGTLKENANGVPEVDPDTYLLEVWDVVINPGIPGCRPKLLESLDKIPDTKLVNLLTKPKPQIVNEDKNMEMEKLFERQTNDLVETKSALVESANQVKSLNETVTKQRRQLNSIATIMKSSTPIKSLGVVAEGIRKWLQLEPFATIARKEGIFNRDGVSLEDMVQNLGAAHESFAKATRGLSPEALTEALAELDEHRKNGNAKRTAEGIKMLKDYIAVSEGRRPEKLKKVLENAKIALKNHKTAELAVSANKLVKQYEKAGVKVDPKVVRGMLRRTDEATVINDLNALFSKGQQSVESNKFDPNFASRYKKTNEGVKKPVVKKLPQVMEKLAESRDSQNALIGDRGDGAAALSLFENIKVSDEPMVTK